MILKSIEELGNLDLKKLHYDDLVKCLQFFINGKNLKPTKSEKMPFYYITFHKNFLLFRGRLNDDYNVPFNSEKEISYRQDLCNIKSYGRANKKHKAMWYGAYNTPKNSYIATIFGELKEWKDWEKHDGNCYSFTVGEWEVTEDIELVHVLMEDDPKFEEFKKHIIKKVKNANNSKKIIDITKFMAKEFSKRVDDCKDYNYKISAAFTEIILEYDRLHGIIYPTIQSENSKTNKRGMNIALTPQAVDDCLQLKKVYCYGFCNEKMTKDYDIYRDPKMTSCDLGLNNSNFNWEKNINCRNNLK